jgi:hypothetical protein
VPCPAENKRKAIATLVDFHVAQMKRVERELVTGKKDFVAQMDLNAAKHCSWPLFAFYSVKREVCFQAILLALLIKKMPRS